MHTNNESKDLVLLNNTDQLDNVTNNPEQRFNKNQEVNSPQSKKKS